jgi:YegS/Rv2252/BmrU family lipid kinase
MKLKTRFILNPTSGRNRRRPTLAADIRTYIATHALDATLVTTEGPGHATLLARDAAFANCALVVAVGGDGTMNEVAQAINRTPSALGLVPCGSGNGLALHLGLPTSLLPALDLIARAPTLARVATIDTGTANGFAFFNVMGLGLDADVSRRFNALTRRGLPAYARTAFAALREIRTERVTLTCADHRETLDVLLVAVANSDQYGNHARIAPGARIDDGALDLVAVQSVGLCGATSLAARLFLGTFDRSSRVRRLTGPRFLIERTTPGLIHTDGETHPTTATVEVIVHSRSLRIVVPIGSRALAPVSDLAPAGFDFTLP